MKSLFSLLVLSMLTSIAHADQCAWNDKETAEAAKKLVKVGSIVLSYCEPCGSQREGIVVRSSRVEEVKSFNGKSFFQLMINDKATDLAYLFLQTRSANLDGDLAVYTNISKMVGCPSHNVSNFIEERP